MELAVGLSLTSEDVSANKIDNKYIHLKFTHVRYDIANHITN